jgi:hypothetical protein
VDQERPRNTQEISRLLRRHLSMNWDESDGITGRHLRENLLQQTHHGYGQNYFTFGRLDCELAPDAARQASARIPHQRHILLVRGNWLKDGGHGGLLCKPSKHYIG